MHVLLSNHGPGLLLTLYVYRQVEHKVELYREANAASDLVINASNLRSRHKGKLVKIEKQLFTPQNYATSTESDDSEDCRCLSEEEEEEEEAASQNKESHLKEDVACVVDKTADHGSSHSGTVQDGVESTDSTSMLSHNTLHDCTVTAYGVVPSKDGLDCQQPVKGIMKPHPVSNYVSVHRTPEIQVK